MAKERILLQFVREVSSLWYQIDALLSRNSNFSIWNVNWANIFDSFHFLVIDVFKKKLAQYCRKSFYCRKRISKTNFLYLISFQYQLTFFRLERYFSFYFLNVAILREWFSSIYCRVIHFHLLSCLQALKKIKTEKC